MSSVDARRIGNKGGTKAIPPSTRIDNCTRGGSGLVYERLEYDLLVGCCTIANQYE